MSGIPRILYLVPGAMAAQPDGVAEISRRLRYLREHAGVAALLDLRDNPDGPPCIETPEQEAEAAAGLEALLPARADGFDAVIIGCFGDPGLARARRQVAVPVIGPAESSFHLAAQAGSRFAVITVVDAVVPLLHERARAYGLADACVSITAVDVPVLQLRERRDEALERLLAGARPALEAGAGAIVLGCMTMGFLDVSAELSLRLGVPVVNPVQAALHTAIALRACGPFLAPPRPETLTNTG